MLPVLVVHVLLILLLPLQLLLLIHLVKESEDTAGAVDLTTEGLGRCPQVIRRGFTRLVTFLPPHLQRPLEVIYIYIYLFPDEVSN